MVYFSRSVVKNNQITIQIPTLKGVEEETLNKNKK
jgi:hypothetical protein